MQLAKSTNIIGGFLLLVCGVVGCFFPDTVAAYYGYSYEQPSATITMRVLAGLFISVGYLLMHFAWQCDNQQPVLFSLWIVLLSFAVPRMLGLWLDGASQSMMWYELGFEVFALVVVAWVYLAYKKRYKRGDA